MCIINELTTAKYNNTVVSLPYHLLDTTSCFPYKNDAPQIKTNSLQIKIIAIHNEIICFNESVTNIDNCVSLSANGSINFPKSDIALYFLAIYPSSISEIDDKVNRTNASM